MALPPFLSIGCRACILLILPFIDNLLSCEDNGILAALTETEDHPILPKREAMR